MKNLILLSLTLLFFLACQEVSQPTSPALADSTTLLYTSFESSGNPTLQGWLSTADYGIRFSQDVPPGGGNWSIEVDGDWESPELAPGVLAKIPALPGEHIYRLTFWGKASPLPGSAFLELINADTSIIQKRIQIEPTVWTQFTLLDTLEAQTGDTLAILLTGGYTHILLSSARFDLCKLESIN